MLGAGTQIPREASSERGTQDVCPHPRLPRTAGYTSYPPALVACQPCQDPFEKSATVAVFDSYSPGVYAERLCQ